MHIQVKTFIPGDKTCTVGLKAERNYGENFYWILGGIPTLKSEKHFVYYIIPSAEMSKNIKESHKIWEDTPGKKGQQHSITNFRTVEMPPKKNLNGWDITPYLNNWELIDEKLK